MVLDMDVNMISEWVGIVLAVIGGLSIIVKGIAVITDITPGTRDDHIVGVAEKVIHRVQKILGAVSLDTSKQKK